MLLLLLLLPTPPRCLASQLTDVYLREMRNNWSGIAQLQYGKNPCGQKLGGADTQRVTKCLVGDFYAKAFVSKETATANKTTSNKVDTTFTESKATYKPYSYNLPTKFSNTELFPALWPPTTAICGRSKLQLCPMELKASWSLLMRGMRSSIPRFPIAAARSAQRALCRSPGRLNKSRRVAVPANQKFPDGTAACHSHREFIS